MITEVKRNYVTYRMHDDFDKYKIITDLKTTLRCKPYKAFWGSPEKTEYGWKDWCINNEFHENDYFWDKPIKWTLEPGSKILEISFNEIKEIKPDNCLIPYIDIFNDYDHTDLSKISNEGKIKSLVEDRFSHFDLEINFERMKKDGIVGVELMNACIGHYFWNSLEVLFNGWDCESICILDPSKIIWL